MTNQELCLPDDYQSRPANNTGWEPTDTGMRPVHQWIAKRFAGRKDIRTVADWGCGTGAMLMRYFSHLDTVGVETPERFEKLIRRYPDRTWLSDCQPVKADLITCVDVIEHLDDPIGLLRQFAAGTWRHLVISTPDRSLVAVYKCHTAADRRRQLTGPPRNYRHTREWTQEEFARLITQYVGVPPTITLLGRFNILAICYRLSGRPDAEP